MLAHFGNCRMRDSLADNLNLTGTARNNLTIRHKLRLTRRLSTTTTSTKRSRVPAAWELIVRFYNHSELECVNKLARQAGCKELPFRDVEPLVDDTGERFFSEHIKWMKLEKPKVDANDMRICQLCLSGEAQVAVASLPPLEIPPVVPPPQLTVPPAPAPFIPPALFVPPPMLVQQAPFNPFFMMMPTPAMSFPQFCCIKCREHCFRQDKRGRPPHNNRCAFKVRLIKKQ